MPVIHVFGIPENTADELLDKLEQSFVKVIIEEVDYDAELKREGSKEGERDQASGPIVKESEIMVSFNKDLRLQSGKKVSAVMLWPYSAPEWLERITDGIKSQLELFARDNLQQCKRIEVYVLRVTSGYDKENEQQVSRFRYGVPPELIGHFI